MKKFLVVLLSLGLIVGFCATASAVDLKVSGSYYVAGVYDSNEQLAPTNRTFSRSFFWQQLRIQPVFQVAEGLTLTTRFDALEKGWGNTNWATTTTATTGSYTDSASSRKLIASNTKIQESIEFERAYVTFQTGLGKFDVGYQAAGMWGTSFADNGTTRPRIFFTKVMGPFTLAAVFEKAFDNDSSSITAAQSTGIVLKGLTDADDDNYILFGLYNFKGGVAGLLYEYMNVAHTRASVVPYKAQVHIVSPYVKATFGPIYVESEIQYLFGKTRKYDVDGAGVDQTKDGWDAYLKAQYNIGPGYFGGQVGWSQGDDGSDATKDKAGNGGGEGWNPCLILGNDDLLYWKTHSDGGAPNNTSEFLKRNILLYQVFGGYAITPKLSLWAGYAYAERDKATTATMDKKIGSELDFTATYKIYDNLSYMVGAGYLWAGDYWKSKTGLTEVGNDYLLLNKLTLSF